MALGNDTKAPLALSEHVASMILVARIEFDFLEQTRDELTSKRVEQGCLFAFTRGSQHYCTTQTIRTTNAGFYQS